MDHWQLNSTYNPLCPSGNPWVDWKFQNPNEMIVSASNQTPPISVFKGYSVSKCLYGLPNSGKKFRVFRVPLEMWGRSNIFLIKNHNFIIVLLTPERFLSLGILEEYSWVAQVSSKYQISGK